MEKITQHQAAALLEGIAAALNALAACDVDVRLKHGAVITRYGYVLPVEHGYVARTLLYTEFSPDDSD
jgi:hypothetical protein